MSKLQLVCVYVAFSSLFSLFSLSVPLVMKRVLTLRFHLLHVRFVVDRQGKGEKYTRTKRDTSLSHSPTTKASLSVSAVLTVVSDLERERNGNNFHNKQRAATCHCKCNVLGNRCPRRSSPGAFRSFAIYHNVTVIGKANGLSAF